MSGTWLRKQKSLGAAVLATIGGLAALSCADSAPPITGVTQDNQAPTVSISRTPADSVIDVNQGLQVTINASDNLALANVQVVVSGVATSTFDTTFTTVVQAFSTILQLEIASGSTGGRVSIVARARDGSGNEAEARDSVAVTDEAGPTQQIISLTPPTSVPAGDTLRVRARFRDPSGVVRYGVVLRGTDAIGNAIVLAGDSANLAAAPDVDTTATLRIAIPDSLVPGTYGLRTFATDNVGNTDPTLEDSATINVVDVAVPAGAFVAPAFDAPIVAGDSMRVRLQASDLSGVESVLFEAFAVRGIDTLGTADTVVRFEPRTAALGGARDTTVVRDLAPILSDSTVERVILLATITDVAGNSATVTSRVNVVGGRFAVLTSPLDGSDYAVGTPLPIVINAHSPNLLTRVGYVVSGVVSATDTVTFAAPVADSVHVDSLILAANADLGPVTVRPFAIDAAGNVIEGGSVSVTLTDAVRPVITMLLPAPNALVRIGDTVRVQVRVQDNKGVVSVALVGVAHRGNPQLGTDVVIEKLGLKNVTLAQNPDTVIVRDLVPVDPDDLTSEIVYIRATVTDSTGNVAVDSVPVQFVSGPSLSVTGPPDGSLVSPGKAINITIRGLAATGVRKIGFITAGVYATADTTTTLPITNPQVKDTTITFVDTIPATTPLGTFTITPFGRDSLGNIGTGNPITINVVADAGVGDTIPPLVTHSVEIRVETDDSITINAQDGGGITSLGFTITDVLTGNVLSSSTVALSGVSTVVSRTFALGLDTVTVDTLARLVAVTAFAIDGNGIRGLLTGTGVPIDSLGVGLSDTLTVVAGRTLRLPSGGRIADALYNPNRDEIYFTNVDRDRIEVFDVSTQSFRPAIPVGSRPWGLDMYPADTLGNTLDTLVVANSGGTSFSMVDLSAQREFRRHQVPVFVAQKVSISIEDGVVRVDIIDNHFSDRPQNVGTVCRVTTGTSTCHQDSVLAVFSTSPTIDQGENQLRGTLRWENISSGQDTLSRTDVSLRDAHLFYEHAQGVAGLTLDTLQILAAYGDTVVTKLGGAVGVMTNIASIPFLDTTFVRSSGNHARVMIGEGGQGDPILGFARAMRYVIDRTFTRSAGVPVVIGGVTFSANFQTDAGVSATINVSDFISNTAIGIREIATNFNGLTNAVRADSVYVLDEHLRLAGIIEATGANPGMDLPFDHDFDATPSGPLPPAAFPSNRIMYTAREDANIDVFDTRHWGRVAQIPIRDPVTGPVRIAQLPSGEQFLIAVTDRGVMVVTLPTIANPFPTRRR